MGKQTKSNMPLDESRLSFQIPRTDQPREKIVKLGRMITDRVPAKLGGVTGNDPEYWGLAGLVTDEMADVALKMGVRKPKTFVQPSFRFHSSAAPSARKGRAVLSCYIIYFMIF